MKKKPYKVRFVELLCLPYYVREYKRYPWSRWEVTRCSETGSIIPYQDTILGFEALRDGRRNKDENPNS